MIDKRVIMIGMFVLFSFFLVSLVSSADTGYCCEKLQSNNAWCQSVIDEGECATGINPQTGEQYKALPTSCEQTSFCTLGTCVNQREGTCLEGVPQQTCTTENGGYWINQPKEEVDQCRVGCCTYGGTAFLGTSTQCVYQSGLAGLEADFNPGITDEVSCISQVLDDEEGACVYQETSGTISCRRLTSAECSELSGSGIVSDSVQFNVGMLCSAPELNTVCGPTERTTCEGYDVYYLDNCGNKANIYDSNRQEDQDYWTNIEEGAECDDGLGNKNSESCGQCDYFAGSVCKDYRSSGSPNPVDGNNICASLDCGSYDTNGNGRIDTGEGNYKHGESWCASYPDLSDINIEEGKYRSSGDTTEENLPGSRYVQLECNNGEVIETACDPFRNTVCAEDYYDLNENGVQDPSDFRAGQCVENKWQDCSIQNSEESCEAPERDCKWVVGTSFLEEDGSFRATDESTGKPASCVPNFAPGFNFWEADDDSVAACGLANIQCNVKYEVGLLKDRGKLEEANIEERIGYCVDNCYCIPGYTDGSAKNKYERDKPSWHPKSHEEWLESLNLVCSALGDCGLKENYIGEMGEERDDIIDTGNFVKKA